MFSPLVEKMIERHDYPVVGEAEVDGFAGRGGEVVLFFTEDARSFPETNDVAMILPELVSAFDHCFAVAVVAPEDQRTLQRRYGFKQWPTLVFLRRGEYLGTISRVQDWHVYLTRISEILASESTAPPQFVLPSTFGACHT